MGNGLNHTAQTMSWFGYLPELRPVHCMKGVRVQINGWRVHASLLKDAMLLYIRLPIEVFY